MTVAPGQIWQVMDSRYRGRKCEVMEVDHVRKRARLKWFHNGMHRWARLDRFGRAYKLETKNGRTEATTAA